MVGNLQARRGKRSLFFAATGLACLAVLAGVISLLGNPQAEQIGQISCAEVQKMMPQYIEGSLAIDTSERIDLHLEACPHCRDAFEKHSGEKKPAALLKIPGPTVAFVYFSH